MNEPVMYIIVNKDLKMSKGKIAAQCCHSACKVVEEFMRREYNSNPSGWLDMYFQQWLKGSYAKIVLKASEYEMNELIKEHPLIVRYTRDEGRTQVKAGSLTTLAFFPLPKSEIPEKLKELKLV